MVCLPHPGVRVIKIITAVMNDVEIFTYKEPFHAFGRTLIYQSRSYPTAKITLIAEMNLITRSAGVRRG